jgi:hypothetical protein
VVGGDLPLDDLYMTLVHQDSTTPGLLAVTPTGNGLLRLRLNRPISLHTLNAHPGNCRLRPYGRAAASIPCIAFRERFHPRSDELHLLFPEVPADTYRLTVRYDDNAPPLERDSVRIEWPEDQSRPVLDSLTPPDGASLAADEVTIRLDLSEPIDTTALTPQTFVLTEIADDSIPANLRLVWHDPMHLELAPDVVSAGAKYVLDITEFEIADPAGNTLGDSLFSRTFSVLSEDDMGAIAGRIDMRIPARRGMTVMLTARDVSSGTEFHLPVRQQQYTIGVPAGRYVLSGFIDSNNNERRDLGSADPWEPAETKASHPDTISVRARFETAGVEFVFD